ncbi:hypothetical protein ACFVHB_02325 [Kitasatospora sp. NPDC127111]|uniref:hypothetical protein n=1 Tax=Kitasatospora sp. NPDC127111 TaxID=3345363 RepID=UPI003626FA0C
MADRGGEARRGTGEPERETGQVERETGQVEAFTAFLGGLLAAGLTVLAMLGAGWVMTGTAVTVPSGPWAPRAAKLLVAAVWLATTVGLYRWLRRGGRVHPGGRTR